MDDRGLSPRLVVVGANFRVTPAALRDRLYADASFQPALLARLRAGGLDEALILSTCDRVEVAAVATDADKAAALVLDVLAGHSGVARHELEGAVVRFEDRAAVGHLFAVAAALESMIAGEPQVLGQVKESHRIARAAGTCGPVLESVLDAAYRTAKRVRNETAIAERPVTIASSAARLARNVHGDLARCAGLLVGDGDMGETIAEHLRQTGLGDLTVAARLLPRAEMLARRLGCHHAPLDELPRLLAGADVVISALATGRRVLTCETVSAALAARRRKPIFFIDAAVPGDVEPSVNDLDGAFVYDLDDLEALANEGRAGREAAAASAAAIVEEAVEAYVRERAGRLASPAVARLRARFEAERARALADAGGDAEKATRLLVNRLLHDPSVALRALAEEGTADARIAGRLLDRLFGLGEDGGEEKGR